MTLLSVQGRYPKLKQISFGAAPLKWFCWHETSARALYMNQKASTMCKVYPTCILEWHSCTIDTSGRDPCGSSHSSRFLVDSIASLCKYFYCQHLPKKSHIWHSYMEHSRCFTWKWKLKMNKSMRFRMRYCRHLAGWEASPTRKLSSLKHVIYYHTLSLFDQSDAPSERRTSISSDVLSFWQICAVRFAVFNM